MSTMKAYEFSAFGFDSIKLVDYPEPKPGPGQVLLKMKAWSLNYRDLMIAKGQYNPKLKLPAVPLSDGVGEVVKTGEGVSRVAVGDRVAAAFMPQWIAGEITEPAARGALGGGGREGMLAEYVAISEEGVVHVPEHLSDEQGATLPCAAVTAWHALVGEGRLKAGDSVLVQGTGGVSIFALQFAKATGARVIITSSQDKKLAKALEMGATDGINYKSTPVWEKKVLELTGGRGVDYVVEVGGAGTLGQSMRAVKLGGQISLIGVLSGVGEVNPLPILMKNIRVQGIFVGSREMFENMNRAIALHRLTPIVDRVFPFADALEAFRYMESGAHFGKVAIRM
jgi:NADPH:quinone reductase-like Zn-dependent oxidoreductase